MTNLYDKVVVLTGASRGIGQAAAYKFVENGCKMVLVARSQDRLNQLATELGSAQTLVIPADLSRPEVPPQIIEQTISHFGRLDILLNNAAVGIYGPGETASMDNLKMVMQINFFSPLHLMQAAIPHMRTSGGGLIINVSSIVGRRATPLSAGYCASKAALERLVEAMRLELASDNIRFSTLYPGVTQTGFTQNALGHRSRRRGRVQGIAAEKVASKLVQMARKSPRDAYVTLIDRAYVTASQLFPRLMDFALQRYFGDN